MLTAEQIGLCKDVGYGVAIVGSAIYHSLQHRQNATRIAQTDAKLTVGYDDIKGDLDAIRSAVQRVEGKLVGGDRRAPRSPSTTPTSGASQHLPEQRRRWGDSPNYRGLGEAPNA